MMQLLQRHPLHAALAALAVVLLIVLGFETGWGTRISRPAPGTEPVKAAAIDAKLLPPLVLTTPEQAYPETGTRPLFTPTRRSAPAAAAAASMVKGQYVLHGVTIVGNLRIGMLKEKSSGRTVRAEKGKEVNGMTVAEVEPDRVTLRLGDDAETLPLHVQRAGGAPATAAAPLGPFSTPAPSAPAAPAPGAPAPGTPPRAQIGQPPSSPSPAPAGTTVAIPGQTPATAPSPGLRSDPPSAAQPATGSLTPEEILARRRARRAQPGTQ